MNDDRVITEQAQAACYFRKVYFGNISIGVSEPSDKVVFFTFPLVKVFGMYLRCRKAVVDWISCSHKHKKFPQECQTIPGKIPGELDFQEPSGAPKPAA